MKDFKKPSAAATVAVFDRKNKKFLLIKRKTEPFKNKFAFPGGFLDTDKEDLYDTAVRELKEETGVSVEKNKLILIDVGSDPKRDPRGHVIDVRFLFISDRPVSISNTDEAFSVWINLEDICNLEYAFDHKIFANKIRKYLENAAVTARME